VRDPDLKRPIWLTPDQRLTLRRAAVKALHHTGADVDLCEAILRELVEATHRDASVTRVVRMFAAGLQMPAGTVPVHLSENQAQQIVQFGSVEPALARVLLDRRPYRRNRR
jgi:hypothetical protein